MVQTYNEFKVFLDDAGKVIEKKKTKRGTVRIDAATAKVNNDQVVREGLIYELAKSQPKVDDKKPNVK